MIDCRECRERLSDLLEDEFVSNEAPLRAALRAHLETCASCRAEFELLSAVRDELRAFAEVPAPTELRARVRSRLIQEKSELKPSRASLAGSFRLPRLALSGGALLAACCLLLLVRSEPFEDLMSPGELNSAPPTMDNFRVPDNAFEETSQERIQRQAAQKAPKTGRLAKKSLPRAINPSDPVPDEALSNPALPALSQEKASHAPAIKNPTPRSTPSIGSEIKKEMRGEARIRATRPQPDAKSTVPAPATSAGTPTGESEVLIKPTTPQGLNDAVATPENTRPEPSAPATAGLPGMMGERGPAGPLGPQGPAGPPGVSLDTNNKGANKPLMAEGPPGTRVPGGFAASRAAKPGLPLEKEAPGFAGQSAAPSARMSSTPSLPLMADASAGAESPRPDKTSNPAAGMLRTPGEPVGRSALTIHRTPPAMLATQKADYIVSPGATQVVNLSFVPEKDMPLAQLRVTLPSGLRFGDESDINDKRKNLKTEEKLEVARILWRGAALKGMSIENAVELRAVAPGRHTVLLILEGLDGKPLQTKSVLFQVEEAKTPEKSKATPGETK